MVKIISFWLSCMPMCRARQMTDACAAENFWRRCNSFVCNLLKNKNLLSLSCAYNIISAGEINQENASLTSFFSRISFVLRYLFLYLQ